VSLQQINEAGVETKFELMMENSDFVYAVCDGDMVAAELAEDADEEEMVMALSVAVSDNSPAMIKLLLAAGADPASKDAGIRMLNRVCRYGLTAAAREMTDAGVDISAKDRTGMTAIQMPLRINTVMWRCCS
jgi:ankyrin repeat protein